MSCLVFKGKICQKSVQNIKNKMTQIKKTVDLEKKVFSI